MGQGEDDGVVEREEWQGEGGMEAWQGEGDRGIGQRTPASMHELTSSTTLPIISRISAFLLGT